jgi:hypothetical protein
MLKPCPVPGKPKSNEIIAAFIAGAPPNAEGHVLYGVKEGNAKQWNDILRSGEPFYFIDNSYFDRSRGTYYRITRNRVQHDGRGRSITGGQRLSHLNVRVREERFPSPPGWVVVVPQSPVFMQLTARTKGWIEGAMESFDQAETVFRVRPWSADKRAVMTTLQEDLARASWLMTHSSAAAVEAVCAGVRVMVSPMSCANGFGSELPSRPERQAWAEVLADNQFTLDEMRSGFAWSMIHG